MRKIRNSLITLKCPHRPRKCSISCGSQELNFSSYCNTVYHHDNSDIKDFAEAMGVFRCEDSKYLQSMQSLIL